MASLLFGRRAAKIGELQLDVTLNETHIYENEISEYPVEGGSTISDHIRLQPDMLNMEGFVTNSPIEVVFPNLDEVLVDNNGTLEVKRSTSNVSVNAVENAHQILLRMAGRRTQGKNITPEVITIITGLRVYTNMVIQSLNIPRSAEIGQVLKISATFKKIETTEVQTIQLPAVQKNINKVEKGNQNPRDTKTKETQKVSTIKRAWNSVVSLAGQ